MGWLDQGIWSSISDLLGDLSALSSYEDALAEAVYEDLDHLVTQKEDLLGSPGGCLCLPSWDLWLSPPTGCACLLSVCRPHVCPKLTEEALQSGRMASQSPMSPEPPSILQEPGLSPRFFCLNTCSVGVRRVISVYSVTFFSTLRFLSDDSVNKMSCCMRDNEDNNDHRSAPGNRGGPAETGCWGGQFPS